MKLLGMLLVATVGFAGTAEAATYNVSNSSALTSALNKARGGDRIVLSGGKYGKVTIKSKFSSSVTVQSSSVSNPAEFSGLGLDGAENLILENLNVRAPSGTKLLMAIHATDRVTLKGMHLMGALAGGYGDGTGIYLSSSTNFTISGSKLENFMVGMKLYDNNGVDILSNQILACNWDGLTINKTHNLLISKNHMTKKEAQGQKHADVIQFGNVGDKAPNSDVHIVGNTLEAPGISHGIYFGNLEVMRSGAGTSQYYRNFVIENNTIRTQHLLGIGAGETIGLTIRNNSILRFNSKKTREIETPVVVIQEKSSNVSVTGNTTYVEPYGSSNFQPSKTPGAWNISNNNILGR